MRHLNGHSHQPFEKFGAYLVKLRKQQKLSRAKAARQLKLKTRQQLYNYEIGRTLPSGSLLTKLAQLYHEPPNKVLEMAYWPQLILLPLIAVIDPGQLPKDFIEELEKGLDDEERRKITQYIDKLLSGRDKVKQHTAV